VLRTTVARHLTTYMFQGHQRRTSAPPRGRCRWAPRPNRCRRLYRCRSWFRCRSPFAPRASRAGSSGFGAPASCGRRRHWGPPPVWRS